MITMISAVSLEPLLFFAAVVLVVVLDTGAAEAPFSGSAGCDPSGFR
jgi:hypothetical protein